MSTAQSLVAVAREAGFRESGVTATKARTIAGIRCSLRLEVRLAAVMDPHNVYAWTLSLFSSLLWLCWPQCIKQQQHCRCTEHT